MRRLLHYQLYQLFILLILATHSVTVHAEINDGYDSKNIPKELLQNVNAVVRNYSLTLKVEDIENAKLHCKFAVTVLNQGSRHHGELILDYDRFRKIKKINGKLYDARGNKIRKLDKGEIKDYA